MNTLRRSLSNWLLIGLAVLSIIIAAILLYSALAPFEPYQLNSFKSVPDVACASDPVKFFANRSLAKGTYDVTVGGAWHKKGSPYYLETAPGTYPLTGKGLDKPFKGYSPQIHYAPRAPGKWFFVVKVTITGQRGILPRTQTIVQDGGYLKVQPLYAKPCQDRILDKSNKYKKDEL